MISGENVLTIDGLTFAIGSAFSLFIVPLIIGYVLYGITVIFKINLELKYLIWTIFLILNIFAYLGLGASL